MRKKSIFILLILLGHYILFSQESIDVNPNGNPLTNLTAGELVQNVLISNNSITFDPTNITILEDPVGIGNPELRSWGYFTRGNSDFPFEEGIILSTGIAVEAEGPNNNVENGLGLLTWSGDEDLKSILDQTNGDHHPTFNATGFQFDFIPEGDTLVFDFIFASEEYENNYECSTSYRDGFVFLIKGPGIPNDSGAPFGGSNIAAIPNSNNIAVNTGSVHTDLDGIGNPFRCGNEQLGVNFFPELYISNSGVNNTNVVQFDGYTTILNTETEVEPGETYTIKIVIADRGDERLDSAVFIRGFSIKSNVVIVDESDSDLDFTMCIGNQEVLTATHVDDPFSGSETYEWRLNDVPIPGASTANITVSESGTYTVIVTDLGLEFEDSITVTVITVPDAGISNAVTLCSTDDPIDLFGELGGTPDTNGTWSPSLQSGTGIFNPAIDSAGIYTYTVTGDQSPSCPDDSATIDVTVDTTPTLSLIKTICSSDEETYTVSYSTNGTWDLFIDPSGTATVDMANSLITGIESDTDIKLTATNPDNNNCEVVLNITSPQCKCPTIAIPTNASNETICLGDVIPTLSVDVLNGQTANWYEDNGTLLSFNTLTYTPTVTEKGTYIFKVEAIDNVLGCSSNTIDVSFTIGSVEKIELQPDGVLCLNEKGVLIDNGDFPTIDTELSENDFSFAWKHNGTNITGEHSSEIIVTEPGEYTVTYTSVFTNCSNSSSISIDSHTAPVDLQLSLSQGVFSKDKNNDIIATASGSGNYLFSLDNGDAQEDGIFENISLGLHQVTVSDKGGCGSITKEIFVVGFPKFFTPNGDGYHETWNVIADFQVPEMSIRIFDRYGKLLKQLNPNGSGWDGTYNGKKLPSTEYWFKAELLDGSAMYTSHFSLIR